MDDDKPKTKAVHEIGCDLSAISVDELRERITLLRQEIERLEASIATKQASKLAADSFFRR